MSKCNHKENCKKCLREEIESLKKRIAVLESKSGTQYIYTWPNSTLQPLTNPQWNFTVPGRVYGATTPNITYTYVTPTSTSATTMYFSGLEKFLNEGEQESNDDDKQEGEINGHL